jgi:outer membrane protein OmpA-like peptidoglycan-associated protein
MMRQQRKRQRMMGMLGVLLVLLVGCSDGMTYIQQALGSGIADRRDEAKRAACPRITVFAVTPEAVKCGGQVALDFAAVSPSNALLTYSWDIEGQTFQTGQRAVWQTPDGSAIGDPEKAFTVRGIVTDGQCSVTQSVDVTVLCLAALDSSVHFEFGRADLDATAKLELDEIADTLLKNPDQAVMIDGHTDYVGTDPANLRLGERRSEAVKKYLMATWKIDPSRIMTRSFGEEQPIAPNEIAGGRAQNRRAEVFRIMLSTREGSTAATQPKSPSGMTILEADIRK